MNQAICDAQTRSCWRPTEAGGEGGVWGAVTTHYVKHKSCWFGFAAWFAVCLLGKRQGAASCWCASASAQGAAATGARWPATAAT